MWTGESMTLMESLVVSGMGMTVVMGVLILLALSIVALSIVALSRLMTLKQQPAKAAPPPAPPAGPSEEGQCAVILSVICEELRADPADIQIKSIRKL